MAKRSKTILKEYFANGAVPTGDQFAELIDSLADDLAPTTLEVVSGAVTVTQQKRYKIDTENQAATDDLDTINGGVDGMEVIFRCVSPSRVVTFKNLTGNLRLSGADLSLSAIGTSIYLWYNADDGKWNEIRRAIL